VKFRDLETGIDRWIDTSSSTVRQRFKEIMQQRGADLDRTFILHGIDNTLIYTNEDYVRPLMQLFKKRESRR